MTDKKVAPIILKYDDGTEYTLEFNRESVDYAERTGFNPDKFDAQTMVMTTQFFWLAFRMHHPTISKKKTDSILFDDLGGLTDEMTRRLVELYNEPYNALENKSEDGGTKNPKMSVIL